MKMRKAIVPMALAALVAAPAAARADWVFAPFLGQTFGNDAPDENLNYGASLTWMGRRVAGFEIDFSSTPDFWGESAVFGENNVTTLMGNLVIGAPIETTTGLGLRPYGAAGLGLIRSKAGGVGTFFDEVDRNDFGFSLGGGLMGFFHENVGARVDIRYFRTLTADETDRGFDLDPFDLGNFDYWRWSLGLAFRW
jgi:opacity protein-like surface antigen